MKRLGVNIDHIATLRNARGEKHPNPVFAAKEVLKKACQKLVQQVLICGRKVRLRGLVNIF